jgi:S1-C subfamily serine protease
MGIASREAAVAADPGEEPLDHPSPFVDLKVDLVGCLADDLDDDADCPRDARNGSGGNGGQEGPHIGLALAPLSPQTRQQLDVPDNTSGAVVAQVQPGSPAEKPGLQPGDLVVGVGGKRVSSPDEAANALRTAARAGRPFALRILRNGQGAFVAVRPTEQNG